MVIGCIYSTVAARKRREGLFALAQKLNLSFDGGQDFGIADRFSFLKQLAQGANRYATNVLSGNYRQNEILAFDYHYETYTEGKGGRQTHHRRENFFLKVAEVFGYHDIKFESVEFSKTFCVRSPDKKFAYDVCNAQMMEYLLANRDLSVEIESEVIAIAFDNRLAVEQFELNLQRLIEIRTRLPEYLFTQNQ